MLLSSKIYKNLVQVIKNLIKSDLIDNIVIKLQSEVILVIDKIIIRIN